MLAKIWSITVELLDVTLVGTIIGCFNPTDVQNSWELLTSLGIDLLFKIFWGQNVRVMTAALVDSACIEVSRFLITNY